MTEERAARLILAALLLAAFIIGMGAFAWLMVDDPARGIMDRG